MVGVVANRLGPDRSRTPRGTRPTGSPVARVATDLRRGPAEVPLTDRCAGVEADRRDDLAGAGSGAAGDAFHVVIPSLPGYGFSTPIREPGWGNLFRVAQAWAELMDRLGYERYAVHGTDVGSGVSDLLAMIAADRVIGTHVTGTVAAMPFGPPLETDGLDPADRERAERFNQFRSEGIGYLHMQATRPQTLAYGLSDSPVAQLAWIVDRFWASTDPAAGLPEDAVDLDQMLTNVSIYWFTGSGPSSAHGTYEGMQAWKAIAAAQEDQGADAGGDRPAVPPKAVAVFAGDTTIRSVMDPSRAVEHWSEFDRGGLDRSRSAHHSLACHPASLEDSGGRSPFAQARTISGR